MPGKKNKNTKSLWPGFIFRITMVVFIFELVLFWGLYHREHTVLEEQFLERGRAQFTGILLFRRWNAIHGGVFVKKSPGMIANPYLENPDIKTGGGDTYTMKNPALMTREISELAQKDGSFSYHITSLRPLNPLNAPDDWEKSALAGFERGQRERFAFVDEQSPLASFRYMAPLITEKSCLNCHAGQGYRQGGIRGGISVSFPVGRALNKSRRTLLMLGILITGSTLVVLGLIYFFIFGLMKRLSSAQERIRRMAVTDELTGLANRRHFYTLQEKEHARARRYGHIYSLIMLDLDHFKKINDSFGHQAGDELLVQFSRMLGRALRKADTSFRYGGEEFMVILPHTGLHDALAVAEKIRLKVEAYDFALNNGQVVKITVSAGAAQCPRPMPPGLGGDQLVSEVDKALYKAKAGGRNRVEHISAQPPTEQAS